MTQELPSSSSEVRLLEDGWLPLSSEHQATLSRIRRSLGLSRDTGLPDKYASVAFGGASPPELQEETVDDLRSLVSGGLRSPSIALSNTGTILARHAARFDLSLSVAVASRRGPFWRRSVEGGIHVMAADLALALDQIESGPPGRKEGELDSDWSARRLHWWARIRKPLLRHGAEMGGYLQGLDVIEVDRLKAKLTPGGVEFSADGIRNEAAFNSVLEQFDPRSERAPNARWRDSSGVQNRQRIAFTDRGRRAAAVAGHVRRSRSTGIHPGLIDAPETILNEDLFDLSEYGDRVVGIKSVVYRFGRSQGKGPGGKPETRIHLEAPDGTPAPPLAPEEHNRLLSKLRQAAAKGQAYIQHEGGFVRVPSPGRIDEIEEHGPPVSRQSGTLVVALNTEEQRYQTEQGGKPLLVQVAPTPPGLAAGIELFSHQLHGWRWLLGRLGLVEDGLDHGMLADDMGLGKTLQVLSALAVLKQQASSGPFLVVAPLSLLGNWEAEAEKFFPGLFTVLRFPQPRSLSTPDNLRRHDLVLCSYGTLRARQLDFGRVDWHVMVADECHQVRNPRARTTHAVLAMNTQFRIGLTGTPVQNTLVDLWSQFDWLSPGFLGDLPAFKREFDPQDDHALGVLRERLQPRLLRRMKDEVAQQLPTKSGHQDAIQIPMAAWQADLYDRVLADRPPGSVLGTLHRLFQVCSDPSHVSEGIPADHPKLRWLMQRLKGISEKGEKVLVFAEWHRLQQSLIERIETAFGVHVERINGAVEAGRRLDIVNEFNGSDGFQVLMLGPKAAGVGLNLTGANHVVHYTRHWNPAIEAQATDRAYRIGQSLPVQVYLPTMIHPERKSIEASLHGLLLEKASLAREVVVPSSALDVGQALVSVVLNGGDE